MEHAATKKDGLTNINEGSAVNENATTNAIEQQTKKIPSDVFLATAIAAMALSLAFKLNGKKDDALFVGQWVAPILTLGVYNKMVKQEDAKQDVSESISKQNELKTKPIKNIMSTGKILLGVLAGAAAGAALGILFAPDKGSATRKNTMNRAADLGGRLKEIIAANIKTANDKLGEAKSDARDLVEKGKSKVEDGYNKFKNEDHHDKILPKADLKF